MRPNEIAERDAIDRIAREWVGTPFHDLGEIKGVGTDCAKFLKCVWLEAGLIPNIAIETYSPAHFLHQKEERFLGWVQKMAREIEPDQVQYGDVVLFKLGHVFAHGAIVVKPGWPNIIHAHFGKRCGVRRGSGLNPHLGTRVLATKFFSYWKP